MTPKHILPSDKDVFLCPHCGGKVPHKAPYMYAPRSVTDASLQEIDRWNIPYSNGSYILVKGDVPLQEIEEFANSRVPFAMWPLKYMGKLYAKEGFDD